MLETMRKLLIEILIFYETCSCCISHFKRYYGVSELIPSKLNEILLNLSDTKALSDDIFVPE